MGYFTSWVGAASRRKHRAVYSIIIRVCACLQETKGALLPICTSWIRALVLEWPSSSICVLANAFWGANAFDPLFLWNCFSFFYILGAKKIATQNMLVEKIWKRPFLAVFFQTSPQLKGYSQEGFEKTGMLFCLHQKSCSCSSSKVNLGQNKLPFPCLAVLKISRWSARPWELCHPFQQSWISFDDPAN